MANLTEVNLSHVSALSRVAQVARPNISAPARPSETPSPVADAYVPGQQPTEMSGPSTAQKAPQTARRQDYLWEGAAIGGWDGAILGTLVSFGPMPNLLAL